MLLIHQAGFAPYPESQQRTGGNMTSPAGKTRAIHADCPHALPSITNFMEPSPEDHVSFAGAFWKGPLPLFPYFLIRLVHIRLPV